MRQRKERAGGQKTREASLAAALDDEYALKLWAASVCYALADRTWDASFQPKGAKTADWRAKVGEHIAEAVFSSLNFKKGGK